MNVAKQPDVCPGQAVGQRSIVDLDERSAPFQALVKKLVDRKVALTSTLTVFETFTPGRPMRLTLFALVLLAAPAAAADLAGPDPRTVKRYGPAFRYPLAGWTVLHVEGEPYERGYQHGRLMAEEIAGYLKSLAAQQSHTAPADGWNLTRTLVNVAFLRKFDREYLDEMKGIADGAAGAGAKAFDRPVDLLDVVCLNVSPEYDSIDPALHAWPTGLAVTPFATSPDGLLSSNTSTRWGTG